MRKPYSKPVSSATAEVLAFLDSIIQAKGPAATQEPPPRPRTARKPTFPIMMNCRSCGAWRRVGEKGLCAKCRKAQKGPK